jgi:hypothetical protein
VGNDAAVVNLAAGGGGGGKQVVTAITAQGSTYRGQFLFRSESETAPWLTDCPWP